MAQQPNSGLGCLVVEISKFLDHAQTPLNEWSSRHRDCYLHNTQQTQETHIHVHFGIWTSDHSSQAAADLHLRNHGHRGRLDKIYCHHNRNDYRNHNHHYPHHVLDMMIKEVTRWEGVYRNMLTLHLCIKIVLNSLCNCKYSVFVSTLKSFTWSCCNLQVTSSALSFLLTVLSSRLAACIRDPTHFHRQKGNGFSSVVWSVLWAL